MDERKNGSAGPSMFDRALAMLHDLPDVVKTSQANIRVLPPLGVGGALTVIVQTIRQREKGDTIFLEIYGDNESHRLVLTTKVADAIARQREAVSKKLRQAISRAAAADLKAKGIQPAFMKKRKVGA